MILTVYFRKNSIFKQNEMAENKKQFDMSWKMEIFEYQSLQKI